MDTKRNWDNYGDNSQKTSIVVFIIGLLGTYYLNPWGKWILLLSMLQYAYLSGYYELRGNLYERGYEIQHTFIKILPSVICFYGKIVITSIMLMKII